MLENGESWRRYWVGLEACRMPVPMAHRCGDGKLVLGLLSMRGGWRSDTSHVLDIVVPSFDLSHVRERTRARPSPLAPLVARGS